MPSHYGEERRQAAASRATAQRLTARASRALAAQKRKKPHYSQRNYILPDVRDRIPVFSTKADRVETAPRPNQRKKVGGEAPELKAHGVRKSI
jgi:malic enzyme